MCDFNTTDSRPEGLYTVSSDCVNSLSCANSTNRRKHMYLFCFPSDANRSLMKTHDNRRELTPTRQDTAVCVPALASKCGPLLTLTQALGPRQSPRTCLECPGLPLSGPAPKEETRCYVSAAHLSSNARSALAITQIK